MRTKDYLAKWYKVTEVTIPETFDGRAMQPAYKDVHIFRPLLVCKDGFSVYVQADKHRCCEPRGNKFDGGYAKVELSYPSKSDPLISQYAVDKRNLTDSVYAYVPITVVDKLFEKHGGIKGPDFESLEKLSKLVNAKYMKSSVSW